MIKPAIEQRQQLTSDAIRYLVIAVIGLAIDIAVALTLRRLCAIPLPIATATGFLIAVAFNYVMLERFLFKRQTLSWARLAKTYVTAQGALLVRILVAWGLSRILYDTIEADALVLLLSSGFSLVANFLIVRLILR